MGATPDPLSGSEDAYNNELERLINEGLSCPLCGRKPIEIQVVEFEELSVAECEAGHTYAFTKETE